MCSLRTFAFSSFIIPDPSERAGPAGASAMWQPAELKVNLRLLGKQLGTTHTKLTPFLSPSLAINHPQGTLRGCKFSPGTSSNL